MSENLFAGVELGGTKCIALVARRPGEVIARQQVQTTTPAATLDQLEQILSLWHSKHPFEALGIASFGPLDLDPASSTFGKVTNTPKPGWSGADVFGRLSRAAGVPTIIDTDVNGAALAEMRWGCGQGMNDFSYVTVGTGVGVGLIVNGRPTRGFAHCELGHIRPARRADDDWGGSCPYHGACVEGLASGPALKARVGEERVLKLRPDDPALESCAWALAQMCHAIVCAGAPRAIAIGGGVIEGYPSLRQRIEAMLRDSLNGYLQLPSGAPYIRAPALGADAGPLGSIALAISRL